MISEEDKKLLSEAARVQSDEALFRECIGKPLPVLEKILQMLDAENIPYRVITKNGGPHVRLRVDVRPQITDEYYMLGCIPTFTISRLVRCYHYDHLVAPRWEIELGTDKEQRIYHALMTRRVQIINSIGAIQQKEGYKYYPFEYRGARTWLQSELTLLYPSLARSFNGQPDEFKLIFGDPLNHCRLNSGEDWDLRKASEDIDDAENIWWDDPDDNFDELMET